MATYLSMVTIPMTTLVPKDSVVNTFHVECSGADLPAARAAWHGGLVAFYNNVQAVFSTAVAQNGLIHKMYDMDAPIPRPPVSTFTWNLAAANSGSELPHELAICMSFQGDPVAGVRQSRRRGRIYLGPVDTGGMTGPMVATSMQNTIATAAQGLLSASRSSGIFEWIVWSSITRTGTAVTNGWVDNAMDVQRRRGIAPTSRVTFT